MIILAFITHVIIEFCISLLMGFMSLACFASISDAKDAIHGALMLAVSTMFAIVAVLVGVVFIYDAVQVFH